MTIRPWGSKEYYCRRLGPVAVQVSVFSDSFAPDHVYIVRYETCTCPVGFNCKHVALVHAWVELGEPEHPETWYLNDRGEWEHEPLKGMGGVSHG